MKQFPFTISRLIFETACVLITGCIIGTLNNAFSSRSIPLAGEWDKRYGVPSPGGIHAPTSGNVEIALREAHLLFRKGALFLDARPEAAFFERHIPGALSFSVQHRDQTLLTLIESRRPSTALVAYCQGMECDEAHLAARELREMGLTNVMVFAGGFEEWEAAGYPTVTGTSGEEL